MHYNKRIVSLRGSRPDANTTNVATVYTHRNTPANFLALGRSCARALRGLNLTPGKYVGTLTTMEVVADLDVSAVCGSAVAVGGNPGAYSMPIKTWPIFSRETHGSTRGATQEISAHPAAAAVKCLRHFLVVAKTKVIFFFF